MVHCSAQCQTVKQAVAGRLVQGFHFRGKLPHLKRHAGTYFVTFRLADSLPANQIARLKHEREMILAQAIATRAPLTWHEEQQLLAWYCDKVESLLDSEPGPVGYGKRRLPTWSQKPSSFLLGNGMISTRG